MRINSEWLTHHLPVVLDSLWADDRDRVWLLLQFWFPKHTLPHFLLFLSSCFLILVYFPCTAWCIPSCCSWLFTFESLWIYNINLGWLIFQNKYFYYLVNAIPNTPFISNKSFIHCFKICSANNKSRICPQLA